jgi:uncharacterized iron-regulated protein
MSAVKPGVWISPEDGRALSHQEMMLSMSKKQAVLLGETHDRYDIHRWQLHVLASLHALRGDVMVAFEMFPRAVQPALDRWVAGESDVATFLEEARWAEVWRFDPELYLPIFHFCRQFRMPMIAANCRRALVTEVGKLGWDAIAVEDRDDVTPAAEALPEYRRYLFNITGGARTDRAAQSAEAAEFDRFVRAQQTWDRAFACAIADAHQAHAGALVVGIIGRGHLEYGYGTPFQLQDLGMADCGILLPHDGGEVQPGISNALFCLQPLAGDKAERPT